MNARANVAKWGHYWRTFRSSLTHQVYLESVAAIITARVKHCCAGKNHPMLLDIGCGQGQLDAWLAERTGWPIVAVDIVAEALAASQQLLKEKKLRDQVSLVLAVSTSCHSSTALLILQSVPVAKAPLLITVPQRKSTVSLPKAGTCSLTSQRCPTSINHCAQLKAISSIERLGSSEIWVKKPDISTMVNWV